MQGEPRLLVQPGMSWAWQHGYDIYGQFIVKRGTPHWGPGLYHCLYGLTDPWNGLAPGSATPANRFAYGFVPYARWHHYCTMIVPVNK